MWSAKEISSADNAEENPRTWTLSEHMFTDFKENTYKKNMCSCQKGM